MKAGLLISVSIIDSPTGPSGPPPAATYYLRPDGVSFYNRPDGVSLYVRP